MTPGGRSCWHLSPFCCRSLHGEASNAIGTPIFDGGIPRLIPRSGLDVHPSRGVFISVSAKSIPSLVQRLYAVVGELEELFPGRKFTLDGHLVGSIGEVLAAHYYGLELLPASAPTHDAVAPDGRMIQVKATQARSVALRAEPEHLLVLRLNSDGSFDEVYNGPGDPVWEGAGKMQKNGQRPIGVGRLTALMENVAPGQRLPRSVVR